MRPYLAAPIRSAGDVLAALLTRPGAVLVSTETAAALGLAVIQREGAAAETLNAADVVCGDILSALELLTNPLRLVATLRS